MITAVVTDYLRNRAKNVSVLGSLRFSFTVTQNRLAVPNSLSRKFLAAFNFFVHTSYAIFIIIRLLQYQLLKGNKLDAESKILLELGCLIQLVSPFVCHLCFFLREEAVATLINQFLVYFSSIEDKQRSKTEKVCEILFKFITIMAKIIGPTYICIAIFKPEAPLFLSSLDYPATSLNLLARLIYALPFIYIMFTWWANLLFLGTFLGYIFSTLAALYDMK